MKKNSKIIIVGVLLIVVVLIATSVSVAFVGNNNNSYAATLERANRYLESGDYDNAVLMFRAAIEKDDSQIEPYYGLYRAYYALGQSDLARVALQVGYRTTQNSQLEELLRQFDSVQASINNIGDDNKNDGGESTGDPTLNTSLLKIFAAATYDDYCLKYPEYEDTYANGVYTMTIQEIGAKLVYEAEAIDSSRSRPYSNRVPAKIVLDNVTTLFGGINNLSFEQIKSLSGVMGAVKRDNALEFTYDTVGITIQLINGKVTSASENTITPTQTIVEEQEKYTISLTVTNATDNSLVSDAKVKAFKAASPNNYVEGMTDSFGKVTLEVEESGVYTIDIQKEGFITEQFQVEVFSGATSVEETLILSPVMSTDTIRFVLTWGSSPRDLDSHLVGTAGDGTNVHNYYAHHETRSGGETIVELDVDDRDGYGPETTTLYDTSGSYEFMVDDFTDSGTISSSGATVKIYVGSSLYTTVTITAGVEDVWHVCTIDNGVITVTNRNN